MVLGMASLSWETWKIGWIAHIEFGSQSVNKCEPTFALMVYGPRFFSYSFLDD